MHDKFKESELKIEDALRNKNSIIELKSNENDKLKYEIT